MASTGGDYFYGMPNREPGAAAGKAVKHEHFRAGKVGGWREVMTPEVAAAFDRKTRAMVEGAVGGGPPIS